MDCSKISTTDGRPFAPKNLRAVAGVLWLLLSGSGASLPACSESRPAIDTPDTAGQRMCCVLASTCHGIEASQGGHAGAAGAPMTPGHCHEIGHDDDPDACRAAYDACLDVCGVTERDEAEAEQECK